MTTINQVSIRTKRPHRRMLKFFARCEDGATAVEFSFIAVPFFALIFAIFELAFIFFGTQMLETATADAAREILTGNQQKKDKEKKPDGTDKTPAEKFAAFKKSVCDPAPAGDSSMLSYLFDCNKIKYDISVFTGFNVGDDAMTAPTNFATFSGTYNPGCPGDTVVVRVMYPWNTSVINWPISALKTLTMNFSNMGDGTRLLMAVTAFRNEPYDARNAPPGCPTS